MTKPDPAIRKSFNRLEKMAAAREVELDRSFFDELENYSRHKKVEALPTKELHQVLVGLGREILRDPEFQPGSRVGGGAVRAVLLARCDDPFSTCYEAAQYYLSHQDEPFAPDERSAQATHSRQDTPSRRQKRSAPTKRSPQDEPSAKAKPAAEDEPTAATEPTRQDRSSGADER